MFLFILLIYFSSKTIISLTKTPTSLNINSEGMALLNLIPESIKSVDIE